MAELYREVICKCRCGGLVVNNTELYVSSKETLVVIGNCNLCSSKTAVEFKLDDLLIQCPRQNAKGNGLSGTKEDPW